MPDSQIIPVVLHWRFDEIIKKADKTAVLPAGIIVKTA
jgi:hypothetical protein